MSFIKGDYKILYIKESAVWYPIGCLTENSFSESVSMLDTTTRDNTDGWTTSRPTNQSFNISFSGIVETTDLGTTIINYDDLIALKRARTQIEWKIESSEGGNDQSGYGYITSLSDSSSVGALVTFSGEIVGWSIPVTTAWTAPTEPSLVDMIPIYETAKLD